MKTNKPELNLKLQSIHDSVEYHFYASAFDCRYTSIPIKALIIPDEFRCWCLKHTGHFLESIAEKDFDELMGLALELADRQEVS